jgi:undecaprenyl-diphosphatase
MDAEGEAARHEVIERSPADILRLVVAGVILVVLIVLQWLFGGTLVAFASDLFSGLKAVPKWIIDLVVLGTRVLGVVVLGGGLVWALYRRRWRMLATVVVAGVVAGLVTALLENLTNTDQGTSPIEVASGLGPLSARTFPTAAGIAVVAAMLTAAAPWLDRTWRRAGWALVVGLAIIRFLSTAISFDAALAAFVGWLCGAAVLVAMGAPSRRPTKSAVVDGLDAVGLPLQQLDKAGVDARGSTPYFGVAQDGGKLFVKALGEDERSADLLFRFYRRLQPRDFGDEKPFESLRRGVEHEALVALAARSMGVRTPLLRAFATAEPNGYVLAYEAIDGKSLDRVEPAELTDDVLAAIWRLVGELREHRIAHRDLRLANIFLDDNGDVWLIDFGFSEMAASDLLLATDVAELLASSSVYVGADRAVARAAAVIDEDGLAAALGRLRPWALSGATRTAHKARPGLLDELRAKVAATSTTATPAVVTT